MKAEMFSEALNEIDDKYIIESAGYQKKEKSILVNKRETFHKRKSCKKRRIFQSALAAACLAILLAAGSILFLRPKNSIPLSVYARETEEEITNAGIVMSSGTISDSGEMKGHPLMFYLSGEDIATVRYSCKNGQINFMDWTEKREEFGNAGNFTVPYGPDESEYYYLTIDWVPDALIRELTDNSESTIAALPDEMREDVIVLEITFENGETATKAITVQLQEDGSFFAAFQDYKIGEADAFVRRPDSKGIPRDVLYAREAEPGNRQEGEPGEIQSGSTSDVAPMVCINGKLYKRSTDQKYAYEGSRDAFTYLGKIESDLTDRQTDTDGVPKENFQANHPIVGASVYQYGKDVMVEIEGECWLYEAIGD